MDAAKRIAMIASSMELKRITAGPDQVGVPGYGVIRDVAGKSDRGLVSDDCDLAGTTLSKVYVPWFCPPAQLQAVAAVLQPSLTQFGDLCDVSDAVDMRSGNGAVSR